MRHIRKDAAIQKKLQEYMKGNPDFSLEAFLSERVLQIPQTENFDRTWNEKYSRRYTSAKIAEIIFMKLFSEMDIVEAVIASPAKEDVEHKTDFFIKIKNEKNIPIYVAIDVHVQGKNYDQIRVQKKHYENGVVQSPNLARLTGLDQVPRMVLTVDKAFIGDYRKTLFQMIQNDEAVDFIGLYEQILQKAQNNNLPFPDLSECFEKLAAKIAKFYKQTFPILTRNGIPMPAVQAL